MLCGKQLPNVRDFHPLTLLYTYTCGSTRKLCPPAGQGVAQSDVKVGYLGSSRLYFFLWQANLGMRSWQRQPLARESRHAFVYLRPPLCLAL